MKILLIAINFNSYKELKNYIESIVNAHRKCLDISVDITIADNSSIIEDCAFNSHSEKITLIRYNNIGYLGAAQSIINKNKNIFDYDYVAISNVDITMTEDFFLNLERANLPKDVAWVAPKIYSKDENRDRNPKVLNRYSKGKLQLLYYMYRFPMLFYLYTMTAYKRKKLQPQYPEMNIYAGHGSFMLLTRSFFESYPKIEYPIFLFGEELFLAELVRKANKKVRYVPSLVIEDSEHVSTSTLKKKSYFKYNQDSIKYILNTFHNE